MKRKLLGALIFAIGITLLILLRMHPGDSCEHYPSVVLKGTYGDCEARNPKADIKPESAVAASGE